MHLTDEADAASEFAKFCRQWFMGTKAEYKRWALHSVDANAWFAERCIGSYDRSCIISSAAVKLNPRYHWLRPSERQAG